MTIILRLSLTSIQKMKKRAFCSACVTIAEKGLFSRKLTRRVCLIQHEGERSLARGSVCKLFIFLIFALYISYPMDISAFRRMPCRVCVVSNRFLLVPLSQWCRLAVRKYIHIIFFLWYLIYLKANIYIIAIFLCDIQFVDKKLIYFGIFFCNILQFFPSYYTGNPHFFCKLHMEIKCDLKFYRFCSWICC